MFQQLLFVKMQTTISRVGVKEVKKIQKKHLIEEKIGQYEQAKGSQIGAQNTL